jgi:hypothetical protein
VARRLRSLWSGAPPEAQKDIAIEIVDEAGSTILTLPFWQIERAGRLERFRKTRLQWLHHSREDGEADQRACDPANAWVALDAGGH